MIKSALIPVAGLGTRLLPATKSQPKEMLPVARKPIVQYVVEELVSNGIEQILFITGRSKASIENHFDHDPELVRALNHNNKGMVDEVEFDHLKAHFFYTRQRLQKGLGDAVLCGENFAGEDPFLVALGDSIIGLNAVSRAVSRMVDVFDSKHASCVIAVEEVPRSETHHYGIVQPENGDPADVFRIVNLVEKPDAQSAPSNLAIAGRYIFSPVIFDLIRRVQPDARGEIQLTNAIQFLCEEGRRVMAVKLPPEEKRYDIGNFPSYFESFVEFALADPVYGAEFRAVLERLLGGKTATRRSLFLLLAALLLASRLCHVGILWEGDTLPLAAAQQMVRGKVIYRDIWFDKPPLLPIAYLLVGARPGWALRLGDTLYALLACWIAYCMARDQWSHREGLWAAGLLGFFLIFDFPSAVIPVASDLLMLAPHVAAVWMASRRRPFWAGALAGVAFWISPKGLFVAAVCALWDPSGILWMAAGFASVCGVAAAWLWASGALRAYWDEVWVWGRLYAGSPFVESPLRNGLVRSLNWMGFHIALVVAAAVFLVRAKSWRWIGWLVLSAAGVAAGLRFFPRYYFLLLPVLVLMAARGFTLLEPRRRELLAVLLLIPATRFGPTYASAIANRQWRDIGMDRDSHAAAEFTRAMAKPGDTLFIWGYRPELYCYAGLPAATLFLDSQPLTGVPADRHLTQSEPVDTVSTARHRAELARSRPTFVLDGLGPYNPQLAITNYPDLRDWLSQYREVGRRGQTVIYRRIAAP